MWLQPPRTARRERSKQGYASTHRRRLSTTSTVGYCSMCCGSWQRSNGSPEGRLLVKSSLPSVLRVVRASLVSGDICNLIVPHFSNLFNVVADRRKEFTEMRTFAESIQMCSGDRKSTRLNSSH